MSNKFMVLAATVGAASAMFGAGVASADPDMTGMTYSEAVSTIQQMGATAQVSARVGDRLSEGDCLVTGHTKSAVPPRGFDGAGANVVLVALDCNGNVASATNPGYSAASPEGRKLKEDQANKAWLATDDGQAYCQKAEKQHPEWGKIPGCHPGGE
jgi:hypothetical protein